MKRSSKRDKAEQSKRFIEKAKEIGADPNTSVDEIMRRLAGQKRRDRVRHDSDCAVHDAPAYEAGACTCGADAKVRR